MDPKTLKYAKTHEWASLEGDTCTVGITQFAVDQLTDVVYIELPEVGDHAFAGDSFGEIESVKAVSDLYSPVDGEVAAINEKLMNDPSPVAKDPYGAGWLIRLRPSDYEAESGHLVDGAAAFDHYRKLIEEEGIRCFRCED